MIKKTEDRAKYVVGIGASAGGLEAIQSLIGNLPSSINGVALVIAQHLSPDYKSMLVELLGRKTELPVEHIENGNKVCANKIYIAPPSDDVTVKDRAFYLKKPASVGAHPSIDVLFSSIAKEYGTKAGAVVLSGTGKDGSRGILAIHNAGGISAVQKPATAKYDGMPQAACNTGVVDHILPPEKIGDNIIEIFTSTKQERELKEIQKHEQMETFPQIFDLLERRIGIDFSEYKTSTLVRRLNKRIREMKFNNEDDYLGYIRDHPEELDKLFESLLIGVTAFYRDPESFTEIQKTLVKLAENKKAGDNLRIWIPGCATGEEAYTFAIMVCEALAEKQLKVSFQIFATDIDMKALHRSRLGIYEAQAVKNVPKKILTKYFKKINQSTYEVHKDIRKLVLFSRHDVTANPPFLRLDLISCRNLLIYFNSELQQKVLPLFYYALNPNGYLVLGKSENIGKFQNLFSTISSTHKIYQRKSSEGKMMKFPRLKPARKTDKAMPEEEAPTQEDLTISEMIKETLFHNFDHPFVVVDDSMDIVEINGDTSSYLRFKPGTATLNVNKLVIPQLQIELRAVSGKAINSMKPVRGNIRKVGKEKDYEYVRLIIKPLLYTQPNNPYYLIVFERIELDSKLFKMGKEIVEDQESPRVLELEHELDATKEHMNSLLEELETSNEELQALNEEMQASNEELQASNEELETSNEELQATNEELENAYSELREANEQIEQQKDALAKSAQNLGTLLNNTLVGFILIDRNFKILAVNKTAKETYKDLFKVQLKEGTSFIKMLPDNLFSTFHRNFRQALNGKQVVTEEAFRRKGDGTRYFDFNYTPVSKKSNEKEARYVAVSLVDITKRKKAELDLLTSNKKIAEEKQFMQTLTANLPSFVWTADQKGKFLFCNNYLLQYLGEDEVSLRKKGWKSVIHPEDWGIMKNLWEESLKSGENFVIEHRIKHRSGEYRWHLTLAEAVLNEDGSIRMWVGSGTEIDSLKKRHAMEENLKQLEKQRNELVHISKIKDEFISLASHQLRTPATAVKQYLGIIMDEYAGPISSDQMQYLQTAYNSNERQLTVINDLLKTAQLDVSDYKLNKRRCNLENLTKQVLEETKAIFDLRKQNAVLTVKNPVEADIDYEEMKIALTNIVENASKYSYPETTIELSIKKNKKYAEIAVKDHGAGINKEDHERIFDKFTRIDNDMSDTVSGTGLGLYWVKRIVELHDGNITVESKQDKGSTFKVHLPL
jgi:two-component system, chemotaxis family, CheB/CheR fusion protein